jgi:hypothetical protein
MLRVRMTTGENYRITALLYATHLELLAWLPGPFRLVGVME